MVPNLEAQGICRQCVHQVELFIVQGQVLHVFVLALVKVVIIRLGGATLFQTSVPTTGARSP